MLCRFLCLAVKSFDGYDNFFLPHNNDVYKDEHVVIQRVGKHQII